MKTIQEFWSMNEGTFACLHDRKRTEAFRRAIKNSVRKGDVVVELGAGSGILSMFAADAGAVKVYAIELDQGNILSLKKNIINNGYKDKIVVLRGDATTMNLPQKVDFIICEMIATGLIEELQVPAMNNILRFRKPDTKVLLEKYDIGIQLVYSKNSFYNKSFDMIRFELPEMRDMRSVIYSRVASIKCVDFTVKNPATISETVELKAAHSGTINALRLTGRTVFCDGSTFEDSTSYSFPLILPIDEIKIKQGETFLVTINYKMGTGPNTLRYSVNKK